MGMVGSDKSELNGAVLVNTESELGKRMQKNTKEKIKTNEFQEYIQSIIKYLDELDVLLDPKKFRPGLSSLNVHLNKNIMGIHAFKEVLTQISPDEYNAVAEKADQIEIKMKQALDICKTEQTNREQGKGGEIVTEGVFTWLENEGPNVMQALKELKEKVQE